MAAVVTTPEIADTLAQVTFQKMHFLFTELFLNYIYFFNLRLSILTHSEVILWLAQW